MEESKVPLTDEDMQTLEGDLGKDLGIVEKESILQDIKNDIFGKNQKLHTQGGFLLKQRAFIKVYLLMMAETEEIYGLEVVDKLRAKFQNVKYVPGGSEIYRALYHLMELEVIERRKEKVEGTKRKEVQIYKMVDSEYARGYARAYKSLLVIELKRSKAIIEKGLEDLSKSPGPRKE